MNLLEKRKDTFLFCSHLGLYRNSENLSPNQRTSFAAIELSRKERELIVAEQKLRITSKLRTEDACFSVFAQDKKFRFTKEN